MQKQSRNAADLDTRKGDHIRLCLDERSQASDSAFGAYRLPYTALPELSLADVSTSYDLLGKGLALPLIIASMTGGSEHGRKINTNLAIAATECKVALGVGSQRIGLEKPDANDTFKLVRKHAPNAFILANMGAVQLNYGHGIDSYRRVVDMVEADALYLHLNPLQEALQPGGDTDFRGLLEKIKTVVEGVGVPVFVKEVGHGISESVARQLYDVGVRGIDVAGVGGTSYAWVESERSHNEAFSEWFKSYGIPTDQAVMQADRARTTQIQLVVASGGVRSPLDGLICRALGADLFSAAVPFLKAAMDSPEAVISLLHLWQQGLQIALFASGVANWADARTLQLNAAKS